MFSEPTASVVNQTKNWRSECPLAALLLPTSPASTTESLDRITRENDFFKGETKAAAVRGEYMFRDSFPAPPLHKDAAMNAATALFQCIYLNDLNSTLEELELCFMAIEYNGAYDKVRVQQ